MPTHTTFKTLMTQIEEMWGHQDTLFRIIDQSNSWDQQHGSDWTFADVPYHLAYCNRDVVARPIELGRRLPEVERLSLATVADVHEWNSRQFAARPTDQTGKDSLAEVRASWDGIRRITKDMTDADLERPCWMPFMGGNWMTVRDSLLWTLSHDWSEFTQLRIHMGRVDPVPSPEITSLYVGMMIGAIYPMFLDKEAASGREFTAVMAFTDPGVDDMIIEVVGGAANVRPGRAEDPDLVITQSTETFESTLRGIQSMPDAIHSGAVQVSDMEDLATLGELFPINMS